MSLEANWVPADFGVTLKFGMSAFMTSEMSPKITRAIDSHSRPQVKSSEPGMFERGNKSHFLESV